VGFVAGILLGFTLLEAVVLSGVVYISSSAIITKSLIERGWIADLESESILGVLVFEDLVIAVYLAILAAVVLSGEGLAETATAVGISVGFIGLLAVLAFYGTGLVERALDVRSDELFLLRIVGAAALIGGVALSLGVSEAVAAFFLGAAVGGTEDAARVERVITSERDLYAAVFFFAIGLGTDPGTFGAVALPVFALAVVSTASKLVSGYLGGRAYGLSERRSVRVAVAMVARGEFSLVLAALAVQARMDPTLAALAVGYVLVMSVLGTALMGQSARIEALGFFVLGNTGVYYSYMATLVAADEMGGATAGGQFALVVGSVVAPPAFGYLADTVGYRGSWWLLAAGTAVGSGLLAYSVRLGSPVEEPAMGE